jgi:hypothetical protein
MLSSRRNPHRRATAVAFLTVLCGIAAWNSATSVWFTGAFTRNGELVWTDLTPADLSTFGMVQGPTGGIPAGYTVLGYPAVQFWLAVGLLCGVLAAVLRLGLFSLVGIGMLWLARTAAVSMETILNSPSAEGRFAIKGGEFLNFLDLTWITIALLAVLALQLTYANHVQRRTELQAGRQPEPGVLDVLENIGTSAIGRYARSGAPRTETKPSANSQARTETATKPHPKTPAKATPRTPARATSVTVARR